MLFVTASLLFSGGDDDEEFGMSGDSGDEFTGGAESSGSACACTAMAGGNGGRGSTERATATECGVTRIWGAVAGDCEREGRIGRDWGWSFARIWAMSASFLARARAGRTAAPTVDIFDSAIAS
jgi:hypothetical protein